MNNIVVYTAIFGGKDSYVEPPKGGYDIVLFTDVQTCAVSARVNIVIPTHDDLSRSSKWFKILSHRHFQDYEYSVWMDGSIGLHHVDIPKLVTASLKDVNIALYRHPHRTCAYQEAKECRDYSLDDHSVIDQQVQRYTAAQYPNNLGLAETGVLIRRHRSEDVKRFEELWWNEISVGSRRDQISFNFCAWKENLRFRYIAKDLRQNGFVVRRHLR